MNTLLPNGNSSSTQEGKTMLQGVYSTRDKVVYLTDLLMWNDELMIDNTCELRLIVLYNKLKENPVISNTISPENEIMFRMPHIMDCSTANLDVVYYGLYKRLTESIFQSNFEMLITYIKTNNLMPLLKTDQLDLQTDESIKRICAAFGYDNIGAAYLKDGIAFVHKEGIYFLGYTSSSVQWKDAYVSPYFDALVQDPMIAYLYLGKDRKLQTHDGYIIDKSDPIIDTLKVDQTYVFSYTNILLNEPYASLEGLKYLKTCNKIVWSAMSHLVFKLLSKKNMLPYGILAQQVKMQEAVSNNA